MYQRWRKGTVIKQKETHSYLVQTDDCSIYTREIETPVVVLELASHEC